MTHDDPAHRLPTDTDDGFVLIISGPSGVGKTTITRGIDRSLADSVFSVSVTTRPKTAAEVDGVDYRFIDRPAFDAMIASGDLLEHAEVFGNGYGTPRAWVAEQLKRGRVVILEIDVDGARQAKAALGNLAYAMFILPPSEDTLLQRLRDRKREDESIIQRRFAEAKREIDEAKACGVYDVFIVNDDLDRALDEALDRINGRRRARTSTPD